VTLYRGHHVSLRHDDNTYLVHLVDNPFAFGTDFAHMLCGLATSIDYAHEGITSEPLSCIWCVVGRRRLRPGEVP
jgi:hypothetical protein